MKVALISTSWSIPNDYMDRLRVPYPIGPLQLAAVLEKQGIEVLLIDQLGEGWDQKKDMCDHTIIGLSDNEVITKLNNFIPDFIGIGSLFTSQRDNVIRLAKTIKKNFTNVPIIIGGVDASICYQDLLLDTPEIDYVITGEADESFLELLLTLYAQSDIKNVLGVAYRYYDKTLCSKYPGIQKNKNGHLCLIIPNKSYQICYTGKRSVVQNLNNLPMPAYHLLNFQKYFDAGTAGLSSRGITVNKWMSIFTSRGCPYHCNFCSINLVNGRKWRGKDSKKVLDEIEYLYNIHGINYFFIEDDNMTLDVKRAELIFKGILKRRLKISFEFPNGIRADTMTSRLAKIMKKAGCKKVIFGVENGNQEFLKNTIHKNLDLNKVISATEICYKEGIEVGGFFIIGIPGETLSIMLSSIWFAMRCASRGMAPGFTLATPLPGTEMYEEASHKGYIRKKQPLTPTDYLKSYSEPLMTTPNFTNGQLSVWKKIATILCVVTLLVSHPSEILKTNTFQEIKKNPGMIFKKIGAVLKGST